MTNGFYCAFSGCFNRHIVGKRYCLFQQRNNPRKTQTMKALSPKAQLKKRLKALSPEDQQAAKDGFTYRLNHTGGRVEYARDLQHAVDITRRKAGEQQPQIMALPWEQKPVGENMDGMVGLWTPAG